MALPVVILGDSHVKYMASAQWHNLFAPRPVEICEVGGATAVANRNPNAMIDAAGKFRDFVENRDKNTIIVTHFGESDCGYVIWYYADKHQQPVEDQLVQSIAAYFAFIDDLRAQGFHHIVITGAALPTITDAEQKAGVYKWRTAVTATQKQITDLTLRYNALLKEQAKSRNLPYTDITEDVLDTQTNLARAEFRNPNPAELIMSPRAAAPFWAERLNSCFETFDRLDVPAYEFKATSASVAKGLAIHSKDIPPDLKIPIKENDHLTAKLYADAGEYLVISDATLNGQALSRKIRLIHQKTGSVLNQ